MKTEDVLAANWDKFKSKAIMATSTSQRNQVGSLLEKLEDGDGYGLTLPASTRLEYMGCFPGGLVEHSLRVLGYMGKLITAYGATKTIDPSSAMFVSLFHDIGKAGTLDSKTGEWIPYYVDEKSSWHREKLGQLYQVNTALGHLHPSQLGLHLLTSQGVDVSLEEWSAIASLKADRFQDDSIPSQNESMLSVCLKQAVKVASMDTKNKSAVSVIGTQK